VLLCSFLGGMRAITWTQVSQYVVLLLAFLIPVSWLAWQQFGNPMAPLVYGAQMPRIAALEQSLRDDPAEQQVAGLYRERALGWQSRLKDVDAALAAALSTADGLLLTISNAVVHDLALPELKRPLTPEQQVIFTKFALLAVAMLAAVVAALRPAEILSLVSASFSLAGSAFVPAMLLGLFWRRASPAGAIAGMLAGLGVAVYYMGTHSTVVREWVGLVPHSPLWWGIQPVSAAVFGVPAGLAVMVIVSLLKPGPDAAGPRAV
jgi:Na+(H+)/acetate symporter ActP